MRVIPTRIADVKIFEPTVIGDERGYFFESFKATTFAEAVGHPPEFVQDNQSMSRRGVLRGIHYQVGDTAQGKLVRVTRGSVFDVAVDLRRHSGTFGQWVGVELTAENRRQLWVPRGFGHAFLVLSDEAEFQYKVDAYWSCEDERSIAWNDPDLAIEWPGIDREHPPILSQKDAEAVRFRDADVFA